jgi:pimeloyl-ACP methyl ester carboxylesterase
LVFPTEFTDDELRKIETPTLLLIGDREIVIDSQMALNRSKLMPNCRAELVPDAGHIMNQDQPAKIDVLILKYLKT